MRTIIKRLRARGEGDEGFTLIELLVVLLIIGILLAIAIPTYLSVTSGAKKSAAQSNLNTALTAAKAYYTNNNGAYPTGTSGNTTLATSLGNAGTSLTYGTSGATSASTISVSVPNSSVAVLADYDGTTCYYVADVESTTTLLGSSVSTAGTYWASAKSSTCPTSTLTSLNWGTSPSTSGTTGS